MPEPELLLLFVRPLLRARIRHLVTGSMATIMVRKLEYYREGGSEKHLRDIRSMLTVQGDKLDRTSPDQWVQRRGLQAEWRLVCDGRTSSGDHHHPQKRRA